MSRVPSVFRRPGASRRAPRARPGPAGILLTCLLVCLLASPPAAANTVVDAILAADAALIGLTARAPGTPAHRPGLAVSAGRFDIVQRHDPATMGSLEYRAGRPLVWKLRPEVGAAATTDGGAFVYGGLRYVWRAGRHWRLAADMALAAYHRGAGKRLGSDVLGRSGVEAGWCGARGRCLMLGFHHMSHDHLFSHYNPGVEILRLTLVWPLDAPPGGFPGARDAP
ncbi:MAG TPA: acyloxyacyl hydrolase [Gammaproteobacteria bacterium]|nr:acyloxyacyl hydrolase [Gammaproteobacteria bacterium]